VGKITVERVLILWGGPCKTSVKTSGSLQKRPKTQITPSWDILRKKNYRLQQPEPLCYKWWNGWVLSKRRRGEGILRLGKENLEIATGKPGFKGSK